jgi:hypothetical protein
MWLLISTIGVQPMEVKVNFRSVMPLDVLGDTRVTILQTEGILEISS